jgi:hypothetical protein
LKLVVADTADEGKAAEGGAAELEAPRVRVLVVGEVVRAIERLELRYPTSHFVDQGIRVERVCSASLMDDDSALDGEVRMVFYRLSGQDGGGWVYECHPDGRRAVEQVM